MKTPDKIFLIGFMGSGKSTLGKRLANKLDVTFFDLDIEIENQEGLSVNEIFNQKGEEYFRKIESDVLKRITAEHSKFVLALGGGTPCFNDNISVINHNGKSVYLKYNAGMLYSRLVNAKADRPLLKGKTDEELKAFIEQKLTEREIFYNQSEFIIESDNIKVEIILELLS